MSTENKKEQEAECPHEWKPVETTHHGSTLLLKCSKCGKTKEIELFP
jgi:hypothetical protein